VATGEFFFLWNWVSTFVGPPEFPLITRQSYFDGKSLNLQINQEKKRLFNNFTTN
jgi:hypothetical protein